jgi:WhiB family transcriptional regulator, redox-sensing transcriptional regulator
VAALSDWRDQARCRDANPDVFFRERPADAKEVCAGCPVRLPCLHYALDTRQEYGVWGGLTESERAKLRLRARPGGAPLRRTTYSVRARSTGALCSAGQTHSGWGVTCHDHGAHGTALSRTAAEHAVSRPQEWCSDCSGKG